MKIKKIFFFIAFITLFSQHNSISKIVELDKKFIPLKDFIVLKFDLFLKDNIQSVFSGAGIFSVAYQEIKYDVKVRKDNVIEISLKGIMDKKRYKSKRYYPKLSDCNVVRNKIFAKKYGYSFFKQKLNYSVNEDNLTNSVYKNVLNISTLDDAVKREILNNAIINVEIVHPKSDKNIVCSGKLTSSELK